MIARLAQNVDICLNSTFNQLIDKILNNFKHCTVKQISNSKHVRSIQNGFQIQFVNNQISTFFAYFLTKKIQPFEGQLKYSINKNWTIKTAIMYLGQPNKKNAKLIQIIYENLGLGMVFEGSWSNENSKIEYVYFYKGQNKYFCGSCTKQIKIINYKCDCNIVKYCNEECMKKHIGHHKIFCELNNQCDI